MVNMITNNNHSILLLSIIKIANMTINNSHNILLLRIIKITHIIIKDSNLINNPLTYHFKVNKNKIINNNKGIIFSYND